MIGARRGTVLARLPGWPGVAELTVRLAEGGEVAALAYPALVGEPQPGDAVVVSTAALARGLGTGGFALVVHVEGRAAPDPGGPGHTVKARYLPQQVLVTAVEEPASPHRAAMVAAQEAGLQGLPVVVAELHSALPAVLAGIRLAAPQARVVYVMDDSASLPLWLSRTVGVLRRCGWLAGTVSAGQAFGGDLESITVHSGLLAAHAVLGADVVVTSPGPGSAGSASRWGFSGVAAGEAVNAVAAVGGHPVAVLRVCAADQRERHRGLSHHSVTAYGRVALAGADLVLPAGEPPGAALRAAVETILAANPRHRVVLGDGAGLAEALRSVPVPLRTMGRTAEADPWPFLAAAAAGRHAAGLAAPPHGATAPPGTAPPGTAPPGTAPPGTAPPAPGR